MREDFNRQTWDLWVDGKPAAGDAGFQEPNAGQAQSYIIMGDAVESVFLDDVQIESVNPFGPDADRDGLVDALERRLGLNPLFDDRDGDADGDGVRNLEEAMLLAAADGPVQVNDAAKRPDAPVFSVASGVVREALEVKVTDPAEGVRILYTLDGADPRIFASSAAAWPGTMVISRTTVLRAVAVDRRGRTSAPATAAWVFPEQIAAQSKPEGAPDAFLDRGFGGSQATPWPVSWGVQDGAGLAESLRQAPVVVLSAGTQAFFGAEKGIYSRSSQPGTVAASVICLDPACDKPAAITEAALSISGESSRYHDVSAKHSLRLRFAIADGAAGALTGVPDLRGRQVVLRHPTHDSWTVGGLWRNNRRDAKYFADEFASRWLGDAGHLTLRRQWVHVFLNASYWGVYEAIEQNEADPAGISDLLEGGPGQQVDAIFGESKSWRDARYRLLELASAAASGPVPDADWSNAAAFYDLDSLIDYILINCWMTNLDWPEHNYLVAKSGGLWRFLSWDAELSLRRTGGVDVNLTQRLRTAGDGPAFVFSSLCWWPAFRGRVQARLEALAAEGGLLHQAVLSEKINRSAQAFRRVLSAEAARWGAGAGEAGAGALWEANVSWLLETYAPQRTAVMSEHFHSMFTQITAQAEAGAIAAWERGTPALAPISVPWRPGVLVTDTGGDRDGDGIPDEWETIHGLDPQDAGDGSLDSDRDGLSNLVEYLLGRDPAQAESLAGVFAVEPSGVHRRAQMPRIRNGVRVNVLGRALTLEEAARAAAAEEAERPDQVR